MFRQGKIGFFGGGNMAEALIRGLLRTHVAADALLVADPSDERRRHLAESYNVAVTADNRAVVSGCDLVVLAENALLSTPFVNLALVPEAASSLLMPLRIGYARAYEMFALGEAVDAKSAFAWGLANRVVPLDRLDTEARAFATRLAKQPAGAVSTVAWFMPIRQKEPSCSWDSMSRPLSEGRP